MAASPKRATQRDVARNAGVSQATVSLALGGAPSATKAATSARVLEIARELGYAPNRWAQALRTRRTKTLGVVVPDICNPFFPSLLKGAQSVADAAGYDVVAINTEGDAEREQRILRWGLEGRVDGIIGVFFALRAEEFRPLFELGVGVVRIESGSKKVRDLPIDNLFVDNRAAAAAAIRFLLDRGHRRIAMVAGPGGPQAERAAGYRMALAERGLRADVVDGAEFNEVGGREAALKLLARAVRPTALFGQGLDGERARLASNAAQLIPARWPGRFRCRIPNATSACRPWTSWPVLSRPSTSSHPTAVRTRASGTTRMAGTSLAMTENDVT